MDDANIKKLKVYYEWAFAKIEKQNDIFISNGEGWHEIKEFLYKKRRVFVSKK